MIRAGQLAAAIGLAVVLVLAAGAKLRRLNQTSSEFVSLGLVGAPVLARLVPLAEAATALALIAAPAVGGPLAFALLAGFTVVLYRARQFGIATGTTPSCACFGGTTSQPISARHYARNGLLMACALVATTADAGLL